MTLSSQTKNSGSSGSIANFTSFFKKIWQELCHSIKNGKKGFTISGKSGRRPMPSQGFNPPQTRNIDKKKGKH